jgi:hypothetical protein
MRERSSVRRKIKSSSTTPPEIVLRIPGPWASGRGFAEALPDGVHARGERLVLPDRSSAVLRFLPPDDQFPDIFADACRGRLSTATRRAVDQYAVNACLAGPAGSPECVRRMMRAGAAVLRAGGHGVFLDTSLISHDHDAWLDLTASGDTYALLTAFVNVLRLDRELLSIGMHVFGLRDACVVVPNGRNADHREDVACDLLHDFLGYLLATGGDMIDGALFGSGAAHAIVREAPPLPLVVRTAPAFNPYGRWRIEPRSSEEIDHDAGAA